MFSEGQTGPEWFNALSRKDQVALLDYMYYAAGSSSRSGNVGGSTIDNINEVLQRNGLEEMLAISHEDGQVAITLISS